MSTVKSYQPVVQTYIKDCRKSPEGTLNAIAHPPAEFQGVRYAIAQGPSMVPHSTEDSVIQKAIEFNLNTLTTACEIAQSYNAQLITLPELFLTGYEFADGDEPNIDIPTKAAAFIKDRGYMEKIKKIAVDRGMNVVCPMPYLGEDTKGNKGAYDVAMIFKTDGAHYVQFKNHLWGLDERKWFRFPEYPELSPENNYQNSTNAFRVHLLNGFPVGVGICYDAEFPEVARCLAINGSLLTVFPTAAPNSMLAGQTEPYPDISLHYIPANALTNLNFCSYSNRAGWEYNTDGKQVLKYSGNSIICNPYGKAMVAAIANEDCLLIADCLMEDIKNTQPADTDYLINRRPEIYTALTKKTAPFPYGKKYVYDPKQHEDPKPAQKSNKEMKR